MNIPIDFDSNHTVVATFEQKTFEIFRTMLRTAYGYASDVPESVYLYVNSGSAFSGPEFRTIFKIDGKFYKGSEINKARVKGVKLDSSELRRSQMESYLSADYDSVVKLFSNNGATLPNEVWASYSVESNEQRLSYGYGFGSAVPAVDTAADEWLLSLKSGSVDDVIARVNSDLGL